MSAHSGRVAVLIVGALILAAFTKPERAAHEQEVARVVRLIQASYLQQGSIFKWIAAKGIDLVRTGECQDGLLTTHYTVRMAGRDVARCLGVLSTVYCYPVAGL